MVMPLEMKDALDQIQGAHFTEEETEAQRGTDLFKDPQHSWVSELGSKPILFAEESALLITKLEFPEAPSLAQLLPVSVSAQTKDASYPLPPRDRASIKDSMPLYSFCQMPSLHFHSRTWRRCLKCPPLFQSLPNKKMWTRGNLHMLCSLPPPCLIPLNFSFASLRNKGTRDKELLKQIRASDLGQAIRFPQ